MNLKEFKAEGESVLKDYSFPVKNMMEMGDWVLGYCRERTAVNVQRVLSISHKTKRVFDIAEVMADISELQDTFGIMPQLAFKNTFPNRGYTVMFIWVD
jgi:hypothetical protein